MKYNYNAKLGERQELDTGSVKYPLTIKCDETGDVLVDTTYTVSKRQEEKLEKMVEEFTKRKAKEYEEDLGKDHSNKEMKI